MKTLKKGDLKPVEKVPFYVGKTVSCKVCKWKGEIEKGDKPLPLIRVVDGEAKFKCPTRYCNGVITVYVPERSPKTPDANT